jgi:hypothetical protein
MIVKFVPHEVSDLEPLVALLKGLSAEERREHWQVPYSLMVWLSMVVMVPFDLSIIDSSSLSAETLPAETLPAETLPAETLPAESASEKASAEAYKAPVEVDEAPKDVQGAVGGESEGGWAMPLVESLERLGRSQLGATGPARDAAAAMLARLLTRPGLQAQLSRFLRWGTEQLSAARLAETDGQSGALAASFVAVGVYACLATVFKLGDRNELAPHLALLTPFTACPQTLLNDPSVMRRKLGVKLLQRVALVLLPPRVASWRYQRGARSLSHNLGLDADEALDGCGGHTAAPAAAAGDMAAGDRPTGDRPTAAEEEDAGDDELVPEEIELILEQLLSGLRDADTVVRWSAAKGVGRLTARLPLELADEIVEEVGSLLTKEETPSAWHGSCLALAELARRGLLLPTRLPALLPRVVEALHYDVPRGTTSVGIHVRDAISPICQEMNSSG